MVRSASTIVAVVYAIAGSLAQKLSGDAIGIGPMPELMHLYYDEWPTGRCLDTLVGFEHQTGDKGLCFNS